MVAIMTPPPILHSTDEQDVAGVDPGVMADASTMSSVGLKDELGRARFFVPRPVPGGAGFRVLESIRPLLGAMGFLELAQVVLMLALAVALTRQGSLPGASPKIALLAAVFIGVIILQWSVAFARKRSRDLLHRAHLQAILARIASEVFEHSPGCRVTWFRPRRWDKGWYLLPYARYDPLDRDVDPRPRSRAFYPFGVSYTGLAATHPNRLIIYDCPPFAGVEAMRDHYRKAIQVPEFLVDRISPRMAEVRTIVSYGIELRAPQKELLGVLSVDLTRSSDELSLSTEFKGTEFRLLLEGLADLEAVSPFPKPTRS